MRRLRALALLLVVACVAGFECAAQSKTGIQFRTVKVNGVAYSYEVYVPPTWTPQKKWPVILFLHGVGHNGTYGEPPEPLLAPRFTSYQKQSQAIVVFPRCRQNKWWSDTDMEAMALGALEQTVREFHGDRVRLYVTGLSMGGYGTWAFATRHPGKFAAIAPVCGGIRTPPTIPIPAVSTASDPYADVARKIGKTPVWIFHGSADETISVEESRKMAQALRAAGGDVRYTEYPRVGHNAWDPAYSDPDFFPWLFSHRLKKER